MWRITRIGLIGVFFAITWGSYVFAVSPDVEPDISKRIVFGVTIMIAIVVGLILFTMAQRSSEVKGEGKSIRKVSVDKRALVSAISEQIDSLPGPIRHREEVTGAILNIFNEKLDEKTSLVKQELNQKYGEIIDEKKQQIATIRGKYNQTMTEKRQTESILRSVAEGLVVVNEKGEVILINPAAEKLLGVEKENKIGKPLLENVKDEQLISLVKESSSGQREIVLASQKVDTKVILRSSSAVIENENGKTVGMVTVLSDITKQKELEKLKSDFISSISHELRTPIVSIQKSLFVILEKYAGPLTETQEKFLSAAKRNLERLLGLINDLLDLSKLEAKKMRIELNSSSMEKIINDVCESLDAWANTKTTEIEKVIQKDLPQIQLDPLKITQVLNNIIGNAIKFTPRNGKVTVEAKLREKDREIEISVADNGIGIAKEDLPKVFDKFQQVGERSWTDISGTGLGLSIAKEIVELHHGRIWVESEKGQGAKFTFTLPLTTDEVKPH